MRYVIFFNDNYVVDSAVQNYCDVSGSQIDVQTCAVYIRLPQDAYVATVVMLP